MWTFELNWSSKLRDNYERKNTLDTRSCVLSEAWFWGLKIKFVENYFFLESYVTSEGALYQNVLYYQPLPITRYQVRFSANNYFELPIVSTAFKSRFVSKSVCQKCKMEICFVIVDAKLWEMLVNVRSGYDLSLTMGWGEVGQSVAVLGQAAARKYGSSRIN